MTPSQALSDAVLLAQSFQRAHDCGPRGTPTYCPVITVGGSYPGFLSFAMRLVHPAVVDAAYAASAPVLFYAQQVQQEAYYKRVTESAERSLPGCGGEVSKSLGEVAEAIAAAGSGFAKFAEAELGVCPDSMPSYIASAALFADELFMAAGYAFAGLNMGNYPPDNSTALHAACQGFADSEATSEEKFAAFAVAQFGGDDDNAACFDMSSQLPAGPFATISSGDWSGVGTGDDGAMWDFQTCSLLVEAIGFDEAESMFLERRWTKEWLYDHCQER